MRYFSLLAIVVLLLGCAAEHSFDVQGRVAGFGDDNHTIIVEHEEIDGYMPPMTMPFKAGNRGEIAPLQVGDAVGFTLRVTRDSSWIEDIETLQDDAVAASPAGDQIPRQTGEQIVLDIGDEVADFSLVNHREETLSPASFAGQAYVVTFIYTRCPMPNYCPLMSERFRVLQDEIADRFPERAQLLSITIDPEYDTPHALNQYAEEQNAEAGIWHFATGDADEIERLAAQLGAFYRDDPQSEEVLHNLSTVLVGPDGVLRDTWRGNDWTPKDVVTALEEVLSSNGMSAPRPTE